LLRRYSRSDFAKKNVFLEIESRLVLQNGMPSGRPQYLHIKMDVIQTSSEKCGQTSQHEHFQPILEKTHTHTYIMMMSKREEYRFGRQPVYNHFLMRFNSMEA